MPLHRWAGRRALQLSNQTDQLLMIIVHIPSSVPGSTALVLEHALKWTELDAMPDNILRRFTKEETKGTGHLSMRISEHPRYAPKRLT